MGSGTGNKAHASVRPEGAEVFYLDTSAITKLYVKESGSKELRNWIGDPELGFDPVVQLYTSRLGLPETVSAITRKRNTGAISAVATWPVWHKVLSDFGAASSPYVVLDVTDAVIGRATWLVAQHGLRAYDAVHLASALSLHARLPDPETLVFVSADKQLKKIAEAERLRTADPTPRAPDPPADE